MTVSLCVIAYNEEKFLPNLLNDIKAQSYPHHLTEVVLVDSCSTDSTKEIMQRFAESDNGFYSVKIADNPGKIQASGWNTAIAAATGDVIIRIDAHTHIPSDFAEKNMALQNSGEDITGGVRPCLIEDPTPWKQMLLDVENSLFGSSIAKSRSGKTKTYVSSMFHAAYKRTVFEKVGGFNENLLRTEDNELHYRMRKAGYKFCFDPDIVSYQYARSSLKGMIRQKYANGYWIGVTLGVCPKCISIYHFVPLCFVMGILFTSGLAVFGIWQLAALMWAAYLLFSLTAAVQCIAEKRANRWTFMMPFIFLILHVSYGIGTLAGLIKMPKFRKRILSNNRYIKIE